MIEVELRELRKAIEGIEDSEVRRRGLQEVDALEEDTKSMERAITLCKVRGEDGILSHYGSVLESTVGINNDIWGPNYDRRAYAKISMQTSKITDKIIDKVEDVVAEGLRKNCGCRTSK